MPDGTLLEKPAQEQLQAFAYFPSMVYVIEKPEYLEMVRKVSNESLKKTKGNKKLNPIYPVAMSENLLEDERIQDFANYVGATAWNILDSQGYSMSNLNVFFTELWCQEHHKHSLMEQHVHPNTQLVGFYFLETPENCSNVVFHDTNSGKVQTSLPEQDITKATIASNAVNFTPKEGMLIFSNAWLPHSFGRHASAKPIKFIHFNLGVQQAPQSCAMPTAEVI